MPRFKPTFHRGYGLFGNAHKTQSGSSLAPAGEAGMPRLTRKGGIIAATYYWKSKYAGAGVPELKRLCELEVENAKWKRMYAHLALETRRSRMS